MIHISRKGLGGHSPRLNLTGLFSPFHIHQYPFADTQKVNECPHSVKWLVGAWFACSLRFVDVRRCTHRLYNVSSHNVSGHNVFGYNVSDMVMARDWGISVFYPNTNTGWSGVLDSG